jgi:hypothetical protein
MHEIAASERMIQICRRLNAVAGGCARRSLYTKMCMVPFAWQSRGYLMCALARERRHRRVRKRSGGRNQKERKLRSIVSVEGFF